MGVATSHDIQNLSNNSDLQKLGAHGGSKYLGIGAATGLDVTSFYVREDSTISLITGTTSGGVEGSNFLALLGLTVLITLKQGDLYILPSDYRINALTVDTGSIIIYS